MAEDSKVSIPKKVLAEVLRNKINEFADVLVDLKKREQLVKMNMNPETPHMEPGNHEAFEVAEQTMGQQPVMSATGLPSGGWEKCAVCGGPEFPDKCSCVGGDAGMAQAPSNGVQVADVAMKSELEKSFRGSGPAMDSAPTAPTAPLAMSEDCGQAMAKSGMMCELPKGHGTSHSAYDHANKRFHVENLEKEMDEMGAAGASYGGDSTSGGVMMSEKDSKKLCPICGENEHSDKHTAAQVDLYLKSKDAKKSEKSSEPKKCTMHAQGGSCSRPKGHAGMHMNADEMHVPDSVDVKKGEHYVNLSHDADHKKRNEYIGDDVGSLPEDKEPKKATDGGTGSDVKPAMKAEKEVSKPKLEADSALKDYKMCGKPLPGMGHLKCGRSEGHTDFHAAGDPETHNVRTWLDEAKKAEVPMAKPPSGKSPTKLPVAKVSAPKPMAMPKMPTMPMGKSETEIDVEELEKAVDHKPVYTEEHAHGKYHVEEHGAGVHGVYFQGKKARKAKYIATGGSLEGAKKRIEDHVKEHSTPKPDAEHFHKWMSHKGPVNVMDLKHMASKFHKEHEGNKKLPCCGEETQKSEESVEDLEKAEKREVPPLSEWNMYAPGTGAKNQEHHSYSHNSKHGEYHINPPGHKQYGHHLMFAHTKGTGKLPHGGLWHDLGTHKTPSSAAKAASEHHKKISEGEETKKYEDQDAAAPGLALSEVTKSELNFEGSASLSHAHTPHGKYELHTVLSDDKPHHVTYIPKGTDDDYKKSVYLGAHSQRLGAEDMAQRHHDSMEKETKKNEDAMLKWEQGKKNVEKNDTVAKSEDNSYKVHKSVKGHLLTVNDNKSAHLKHTSMHKSLEEAKEHAEKMHKSTAKEAIAESKGPDTVKEGLDKEGKAKIEEKKVGPPWEGSK